MQRFSFSAKWIAGKTNKDADALSRAPVDSPSPDDELGEGAPFQLARLSPLCVIERLDTKVLDPILEKVKAAALIDHVMQELRDTIIQGFPSDKCNLPHSLRPFGRCGSNWPSTTPTTWSLLTPASSSPRHCKATS